MKINIRQKIIAHHKQRKPKLRPELLLMPNIPKPLHGLNPRTIKGKVWWDKKRNIAYRRQGYHCVVCGVYKFKAKYHKWLEAHEVYEYDYEKGEEKFVEIVALCHSCHNFIHDGRMRHLVKCNQMTRTKMTAIIEHGQKVLKKAKLLGTVIAPIENKVEWADWYLLFEGKKYKGKFESYAHWVAYYKKARKHK